MKCFQYELTLNTGKAKSNSIIEMRGVIGEIFKHYSGNSKNDVL
jgi:hypothetical protein